MQSLYEARAREHSIDLHRGHPDKAESDRQGIPLNSLLILNLTIRIQAVPRIPQYDLILILKLLHI